MTGRRGEDALVKVPVGTTVIDEETLEPLGDLTEPGQPYASPRGGATDSVTRCLKVR